ncbi:bifunctional folylpolyglutamate synthase/dihydrofolate synthase [Mucilaginibacter ginkgonis]|uniref:Dihydrofolate synthase/folylpolyglutamate synthase n=1 Tax=Mucilaginibacter ginkgonis TaxID=2682091 RepID=A0A6I4IMV1_9SPHI|nr:folylpolyglutamate synthase/dihydrofolate synthase family protein [Mucilaginibacter ginkgonis]QQL50046.1 bifunctional folylpolyglutamate synthase/dihydrofolate synthase [Mucilaginibacter ginkgonis]
MTYPEALDYLYTQLPMFTRDGASAFKKDLTNTLALCNLLDNPQHKFKSVHVGGTNGKGSTSHMLAAILQTAGYKTGLYTSPHLRDFRERIRINGVMIPEDNVADFVTEYRTDFDRIAPSFFEMTVAMAFDHFARNNVDIAIIEVGLGGRLDSTNVITPLLSVVTNIGWDHMNMLGGTLPLIATEKAGIIKPKIPVVIGEHQDEVDGIFLSKARETESPITFASEVWNAVTDEDDEYLSLTVTNKNHPRPFYKYQLDLRGIYQVKNVKTVLSAVVLLRTMHFLIADTDVEYALRNVVTLTGLQGRWQTLGYSPLTICDTGHNAEGITEVLKNITLTPHNQLHFVIGMVADKDIGKILNLLPADAIYYFCKPDLPRGLDQDLLRSQAKNAGLTGESYESVNVAVSAAKLAARPDDLVFIGGSTFVVAEVV